LCCLANTSAESKGITPIQRMLASCTGALLTSLFVTPLDVVKIRLQAQKSPFYKGKCFVYCNGLMDHLCICDNGNSKMWYRATGQFRGTLDAFVKIVHNEGLKSLWSGLPPTLVMAVPATVVYFTCYDELLYIFFFLLVGSASVISPLELVRTKMQSQKLSYKELRICIQSAVASDGLLSLWRGLSATLLRDVPFSAMYWYTYELGKKWLCDKNGLREPTFMITFTSGAVSGSVSAPVAEQMYAFENVHSLFILKVTKALLNAVNIKVTEFNYPNSLQNKEKIK
uniref:Solute carrier family 25 member 40 n=1 Tax=Erpetoichthys calabaricus TaxID=27687 RepID=A0A8C4STJ8_ERPCA